jgi:hypothetical protein
MHERQHQSHMQAPLTRVPHILLVHVAQIVRVGGSPLFPPERNPCTSGPNPRVPGGPAENSTPLAAGLSGDQ